MGRGLTFYRDEWIFVLYRDGHDVTNFLSSHAGHLVLWPALYFVFMFKAVGLDHYELYRLIALPWDLACALMVYLLARRRVGDVAALAPAGILLFLGSSWMDILWPFQIGFTGAIAFGLAAILALDREDFLGDVLSCVCLLIAIGWSGASLPFLPAVTVGLLVRRRLWRRIWVVAGPAIVYLLWLLKYGAQSIDYADSLRHGPVYAIKIAGAGITGITGLPLAVGPYLAALLGVVVGIRLWRLGRSSPLAWEALIAAIAFWGITALARVQDNDPTAVRYIYPSAVFLLLLTVGLFPQGAPRRGVTIAVLLLAVLTLPSNLADLRDGRRDLTFTSDVTSAELGAVQMAREVVAPEYSPELNNFGGVPSAAFFAATDRYGSSPADTPDEIARSPEFARKRADLVLIQALRIRIRPAGAGDRVVASRRLTISGTSSLSVRRRGQCLTLNGRAFTARSQLPQGGVLIRGPATSGESVKLRRFARRFSGPITSSAPSGRAGVLRPPPDTDPAIPGTSRSSPSMARFWSAHLLRVRFVDERGGGAGMEGTGSGIGARGRGLNLGGRWQELAHTQHVPIRFSLAQVGSLDACLDCTNGAQWL